MKTINASAQASQDRLEAMDDPMAIRLAVEERLADLLQPPPGVPPKLHLAVEHAMLGQSKRVRPVLLFLMADPDAAGVKAALDLGCAVEMVHTASLILDDLPCMDDAQTRRQRPTTHLAFGQSTAILGAIALLTRAFGMIAELPGVDPAIRVRLASLLSDAIGWDGLVAGQEIDVNGRDSLTGVEAVENLNWLKTGVLFVAAAEMGAMLGGLEDARIGDIRTFARHFGLAFQTADDLVDQTASAEEAGKDVAKDAGKATLVSLFGAGEARLSCQEHLRRAEQALVASGVNAEPVRALMATLFDRRKAAAQ